MNNDDNDDIKIVLPRITIYGRQKQVLIEKENERMKVRVESLRGRGGGENGNKNTKISDSFDSFDYYNRYWQSLELFLLRRKREEQLVRIDEDGDGGKKERERQYKRWLERMENIEKMTMCMEEEDEDRNIKNEFVKQQTIFSIW